MRINLPVVVVLCLCPLPLPASEIHDAAKAGDVAAIEAALSAGVDVDASDGDATALYYAVRQGQPAAARLLVLQGADVNAASTWGPPIMPAVGKGDAALVALLLENGADPNVTVGGISALHAAADGGCLGCVEALVAAGADVNALTANGRTPLHLAKVRGHADVAAYLAAHGVLLPVPAPISPRLAAADAEAGGVVFMRECANCHTAELKGVAKIGPNLWSIVGRPKASVQNMGYSAALKDWGGVWSYEDLNTFLFAPYRTTPGGFMNYGGLPDETKRADLILYLRDLSEAPVPLP